MIRFLLPLVLVLTFSLSYSQTNDATFQTVFSGPVRITAMAKQADDKVIIAGNFLGIGSTKKLGGIVRLNTDGTLDAAFDPGTGMNAQVNAILIQPDGKILLAGTFTSFNNATANGLVRLSSTGAIDNTFNVGTGANNKTLYNLALQSDGKIIVRGGFTSFNSVARNELVRLNTDGSVDTSFTGVVTASGISRYPLVVQPDNKILLGNVNNANGAAVNHFVRLNADGTTDQTFLTNNGTGPNASVYDIALQSDNKILICGGFTQFNSGTSNAQNLARINTDGTFDNTFTPSAGFNAGPVSKMKVLPSNKILLFGGKSAIRVSLHNSDGTWDNSYDPGTGPSSSGFSVNGLEVQADGKFIIVGDFPLFNGTITLSVARTSATGTLDAGYLPRPIGPSKIMAIKELAGGSLLVGGDFVLVNGTDRRGLVKLTNTGAVDGAFVVGTGFDGIVNDIELQGSNVLVGGEYYNYNGTAKSSIARLSGTGTLDATFTTTLTKSFGNDGVRDIYVQGDSKIVLGGSFTQVNGNNRKHFARLNSDGTFDPTFNATDGYQGATDAIKKMDVRTSDGKFILVQTLFGGGTISAFVSLASSTGAKEITFNNKFTSINSQIVEDALFLPDGKILMGGNFTSYENVAVNSLIKVNDSGVRDASFVYNEPVNSSFKIYRLALFNNRILVGKARNDFSFNAAPTGTFLDLLDLNGPKVPTTMLVSGDVTALRPSTTTSFYVGGGISRSDINTLAAGLSRLSETASVAAQPAPTVLQASNVASTTLTLNWSEAITGETGFEIQRSQTNNASFQTVGFTAAGITTFNDTNLLPSTVYYYRVRGVNATTTTGFSNQVNSTTLPPVPNAPSSLGTTTNGTTFSSIGLAWFDNSSNETGFEIYRSAGNNSNFILAATIGPNGTSAVNYTDTGLTQDTQYFYKVRAINGASASAFSNETNRFTLKDLPAPPSGLNVLQYAYNKVKITWTDNSSNETGFKIFNSGNQVGTVGANVTSFMFENAPVSISVEIKATNANGDSNSSGTFGFGLRDGSYGEWSEALPTPALAGRASGIAFTIGTKAFVGLGRDASGALNDLWEFDSGTGAWTPKANFPGKARIGAVAFVINGKAYVGTGNDFSGNGFKRDFYEYDPIANTWTAKADFPEDFNAGAGITSGISFVIDGFGYVGLGNTGLNNTKAFYRYDPVNNLWIRKADFGGIGRIGATGFTINTRGYVAMGYGGLNPNLKDLWGYDPTTDTWTQYLDYFSTGKGGSAAFVIRDNAIISAGEEGDFSTQVRTRKTIYVNSSPGWLPALDLPGPVRASGVAFSIGDKGYIFGGRDGSTYLNDFYSFIPGNVLRPLSPVNIKATFNSLTSLNITWEDKSDNESQFVLEVSIAGAAYTPVVTLPANAITYLHENLTTGTSYQYRLKATNGAGVSSWVYTMPAFNLLAPPAAPTNLTAQASGQNVVLNWVDNSSNETGFEIYRSDDGGLTYVKLFTVGANATTAQNSSLTADKEYFYKILAYNSSSSEFSNVVSVRTAGIPPTVPNTFKVASNTQAQIDLSWVDASANETGFEISRAQGSSTIYTLLATLPANTVVYADKTVIPGTFYNYRLRAINTFGNSALVTTSATALLLSPEAPTNVKAELINNEVVITWNDNASWEESYELLRTAGTSSELIYQTLSKDAITYSDKTFVNGVVSYKYRVRAVNKAGKSDFSNEVSISLPITLVTGILEKHTEAIQVYPSPAQDHLLVRNNSNSEWRVRYLNIQGVELSAQYLAAQTEQVIDIRVWPVGLYLIQFISDDGIVIKKIQKE